MEERIERLEGEIAKLKSEIIDRLTRLDTLLLPYVHLLPPLPESHQICTVYQNDRIEFIRLEELTQPALHTVADE